MKEVPLNTIFKPVYGVNLELINFEICDKDEPYSIRFIARTETNNGVVSYVKRTPQEPNPGNTISVAVSGSVCSSFYQSEEYYSGRDIYYLIPKREMSLEEMMFYAFCIKANKFRFNYGRALNKSLPKLMIPEKMPVDFIVRSENLNSLQENPLIETKLNLNVLIWNYFNITDLFDITGSETTPIDELELLYKKGRMKYPYVTTQATNNGVENFYAYSTEEGNILTVDSAVLGYCAYQPVAFSASDHVEKLIPRFSMNKYIGLFIATIMNKEQNRYNYGRKSSQHRMKKARIRLPEKNKKPDFEFMENYIKSLPYSRNI